MSESASNLTPAQLHEIAIVLENDAGFHREYTGRVNHGSFGYRELIGKWVASLRMARNLPTTGWRDREQLRRYFHMAYELPHPDEPVDERVDALETIEFWRDDVRNPETSLPLHLRPGTRFDTSWADTVTESMAQFPRYGKRWDDEEKGELLNRFWVGQDLETICTSMDRPPTGVLNKLSELRCLTFDRPTFTHLVAKKTPRNSHVPASPKAPPQKAAEHIDSAVTPLTNVSNSLKEILMSKTEIIKIETKTFVNGVDISAMEDAEIYQLIANQEAQVKELDKIETKPKRLQTEIAKRKAGIQALVDYLDSKDQ